MLILPIGLETDKLVVEGTELGRIRRDGARIDQQIPTPAVSSSPAESAAH